MNYKETDIPRSGRDCERCRYPGIEYACTNDLTNDIWLLCKDCRDKMKKGEVWW